MNRRDELSIAHANLTSRLSSILSAHSTAATENMQVSKKNAEMSQALMALVQDTTIQTDDIKDAKLRAQLRALEKEAKMQRSRRRIMKCIVSAVVAGSGVDWARNEQLRQLVIDDEEAPD